MKHLINKKIPSEQIIECVKLAIEQHEILHLSHIVGFVKYSLYKLKESGVFDNKEIINLIEKNQAKKRDLILKDLLSGSIKDKLQVYTIISSIDEYLRLIGSSETIVNEESNQVPFIEDLTNEDNDRIAENTKNEEQDKNSKRRHIRRKNI